MAEDTITQTTLSPKPSSQTYIVATAFFSLLAIVGIAYLGIGTGGAIVPLLATGLEKEFGWHLALTALGILVILIALPMAYFIKEPSSKSVEKKRTDTMIPIKSILKNPNFYLLAFGSMCSIGAVGGIGQHLKLYLRDLDYTSPKLPM